VIELRGISKKYQMGETELTALADVNLTSRATNTWRWSALRVPASRR
jgi:hypothetical protein